MTVLLLVIALAPVPFGSTEGALINIWVLGLGMALAVMCPGRLQRSHYFVLACISVLVVSFALVLYGQVAQPPGIGPSDPIWAETAKILGEPLNGTVSMVRGQPWLALGAPLLFISALILGFVLGADRRLAWFFIWTLAWLGVVNAVYAIAAFLISPTTVLWHEKSTHLHALTGTFLNRNTAADFFGVFAMIWLALLLDDLRSRGVRTLAALRVVFSEARLKPLVAGFSFLLCLFAVFLTASRAGAASAAGGLIVVLAGVFSRFLKLSVWRISLAGSAVVLLLVPVMGGGLISRLHLEGGIDDGRLAAYTSTLNIIRDHPWLGTGLGTFAFVFPAYRSGDITMWGVWNRTHNTLLEFASEMGIPLALLLVLFWGVVVTLLMRGVMLRRRDIVLPSIGLAVCLAGLAHSMVDFSLQIPGYAVLFAAVTGVCLAQSFRTDSRSQLASE